MQLLNWSQIILTDVTGGKVYNDRVYISVIEHGEEGGGRGGREESF